VRLGAQISEHRLVAVGEPAWPVGVHHRRSRI
jgi:hypothetical protein